MLEAKFMDLKLIPEATKWVRIVPEFYISSQSKE